MDTRWNQLAELLTHRSARVKAGERVMIAMGEIESYPLARSLYTAVVRAGAHPQIQFLSEELNRALLTHGTDEQIGWEPEIETYGMEWADVYFGLRGAHNLDLFWDVAASRLARLRTAMGSVSAMRWNKTRWCLLRVPNAHLAHQAGVDEQTITEMFFDACLLDWDAAGAEWRRWAAKLDTGKRVRVVGANTDLTFSVAGRTWEVADGRLNMPDGEIMTSPVTDSVDGQIGFEFPGVLGGRIIEGITLRFETGVLVEATAATNQDFLRSIVTTDPGAGRLGEFAFGTNRQITRFCKDILLDEKIGGTIHIALGRAYPQTGGTNESAIHWDLIKDLRREGEVYLDDELVFRNGEMRIAEP